MKYLVWFISVFSLLPIYIILCIKLNCPFTPFIGCSSNAESINEILVNLSYSYIAASIFFVLINYLPYRIKANNTTEFIENNIHLINKNIDLIILILNGFNYQADIKISKEKISELIDSNYSDVWEEPERNITQKCKHQALASFASEIIKLTNEILEYNDYLSEDIFKTLLKIKSDMTLNYMSSDIFPHMCNQRNDAKEAVKCNLYNLVLTIRSLQKESLHNQYFEFVS